MTRLQGALYAFLFATDKHMFIGATISGWLKNVPLLLIPFMLLLGWPIAWPITMLILAIILRLLYWRARRDGYVRFTVEKAQQPGQDGSNLADNEKVPLRATGVFSVQDWEAYVLGRPAEYWRVARGDHAVMVRHSTGRFLYQFVRSDSVESIESGLICHGSRPYKALAINYLSIWGPNSEDVDFMFYTPGDDSNPARRKQKMFLAFEDEATRDAVWYNLLNGADRSTEEEL